MCPKLDFSDFSCCEGPKGRNTALLGGFFAHLTTSRAAQNPSRALSCAIWPLSRDEKISKVEPKEAPQNISGKWRSSALAWLLMCATVAISACADKQDLEGGVARKGSPKTEPARKIGAAQARAALLMSHHELWEGLKGHRVHASAKLTRRLQGRAPLVVDQTLDLRIDQAGRYHLSKDTHPQYGLEAIWAGDWLYLRHRHGRFARRQPTDLNEPSRIANRAYGFAAAYFRLLGRWIAFADAKEGRVGERAAVLLRMRMREPDSREPPQGSVSQRWRNSIRVKSLSGYVWVDRRTGAPLEIQLNARWSFAPPKGGIPATGIPTDVDHKREGIMTLKYQQRVREIGKIRGLTTSPPDWVIAKVRRHRLEIERQMIMGERPLSHGWSDREQAAERF